MNNKYFITFMISKKLNSSKKGGRNEATEIIKTK